MENFSFGYNVELFSYVRIQHIHLTFTQNDSFVLLEKLIQATIHLTTNGTKI